MLKTFLLNLLDALRDWLDPATALARRTYEQRIGMLAEANKLIRRKYELSEIALRDVQGQLADARARAAAVDAKLEETRRETTDPTAGLTDAQLLREPLLGPGH